VIGASDRDRRSVAHGWTAHAGRRPRAAGGCHGVRGARQARVRARTENPRRRPSPLTKIGETARHRHAGDNRKGTLPLTISPAATRKPTSRHCREQPGGRDVGCSTAAPTPTPISPTATRGATRIERAIRTRRVQSRKQREAPGPPRRRSVQLRSVIRAALDSMSRFATSDH